MYSAEGSTSNGCKRVNYYVPRDEIKPCKKPRDEIKPYKKPLDLCDKPRCIPRILVRRFALTRTAYKYLDIGISVGITSYVKLHLGDNRGNQIVLSIDTWESLMMKRADVERLVQTPDHTPIWVNDLTIEIVKISDSSVVKLTLRDSCLYMKPSTIFFLFELEHCVNHEYLKLCENLEAVNESFDQFVRSLQSNMFGAERDSAVKILREVYDKTSIIDCELLAYAVDELLSETLRRGDVW
ncbi:uncharacterized protein LOC115233211 [Formica exsecta]|uniref:uncharacterized protein LOC115233211 n=1 Tax=Formica exsecta TaxID=72781 RepID=UPI001142236A|nr:uncharacterized protein LOC115233211 [Formica exsecta]